MRFRIFDVDDQIKLKKLSKVKKSFFSKKEDLSLFHFYEVKKSMFHAVFHITDEYLVGTKKSGNYLNVPFSQYINCFFFSDTKLMLIEEMEDAYLKDITNYLNKKTGSIINNYTLTKESLKSLVLKFNGLIKKIEYQDDFGDDYESEFMTYEQFLEINGKYTIEYISLNVGEQFISLYKNGRVSVDTSDEEFLLKFAEEVIYDLENSRT